MSLVTSAGRALTWHDWGPYERRGTESQRATIRVLCLQAKNRPAASKQQPPAGTGPGAGCPPEGTGPAHTMVSAAGASATVVLSRDICGTSLQQPREADPGRLLPGISQLCLKCPCHHCQGSSVALPCLPLSVKPSVSGRCWHTRQASLPFQTWVPPGPLLPPSHTPLLRPI